MEPATESLNCEECNNSFENEDSLFRHLIGLTSETASAGSSPDKKRKQVFDDTMYEDMPLAKTGRKNQASSSKSQYVKKPRLVMCPGCGVMVTSSKGLRQHQRKNKKCPLYTSKNIDE